MTHSCSTYAIVVIALFVEIDVGSGCSATSMSLCLQPVHQALTLVTLTNAQQVNTASVIVQNLVHVFVRQVTGCDDMRKLLCDFRLFLQRQILDGFCSIDSDATKRNI